MKKYNNEKAINSIKSSKFFKIWDILILLIIIAALAVSIVFIYFPQGEYVEIYQNNKLYGRYELSKNRTIEIKDGDKYNVVEIKDGYVSMVDANCKSQQCVSSGKINKVSQRIICVPHHVVVVIVGKNKEFDTIV